MMASLRSTTRVELVWLQLCMIYLVKVLCSWGSDGFVIISGSLWSNGLCRFVSLNFFEQYLDLHLVSSQAALVDIRRTNLFEKFVYALIRETPTMMLGRMTAVVAVLYGKIYVMGGCRADESTHWSEGFDTKIRIGNLYLTLALSPPSLKSKQ
uniref:Uncharacterized protein n=1 Tax=Brassica oleracea TaxID=3712 RepID=A0A3P6FJX7_BRAOL|nr:unnamed protein product [Brassica oleracea]